MNKLRYILDLSNVAPGEKTAQNVAGSYEKAVIKRTKSKKTLKLSVIICSAALVCAAVFAGVFTLMNIKPHRLGEYTAVAESGYFVRTMFQKSEPYMRLDGDTVTVPVGATCLFAGYGEFDDRVARSLFFQADRVVCASDSDGDRELSALPPGITVFTLGTYDEGTFIYDLTLDLIQTQISDGVFSVALPDGRDFGVYYPSPNGLDARIRFYEDADHLSHTKIIKYRRENGSDVIYSIYDNPDVKDSDGGYICTFGGRKAFFTDGGKNRLSYAFWDCMIPLYDCTVTFDNTYSEGVTDRVKVNAVIEQLGLQWFIPLADEPERDGVSVLTGVGVYYDTEENAFKTYGSDHTVGVYYDSMREAPYFDDRLGEGTAVIVLLGSDGEIIHTEICTSDTLYERYNIDTSVDSASNTFTYPVLKLTDYRVGPFQRFSSELYALCRGVIPDEHATLFGKYGVRIAPEEPKAVRLDGSGFAYEVSSYTSYRTIIRNGYAVSEKTYNGVTYKHFRAYGYERHGMLATDLSGRVTGIASAGEARSFASGADTLHIIADASGYVLYCSFVDPSPVGGTGRYCFERLEGGMYAGYLQIYENVYPDVPEYAGDGVYKYRYYSTFEQPHTIPLYTDSGSIYKDLDCGMTVESCYGVTRLTADPGSDESFMFYQALIRYRENDGLITIMMEFSYSDE